MTELYFDGKRVNRKHGLFLVYDTEDHPFNLFDVYGSVFADTIPIQLCP